MGMIKWFKGLICSCEHEYDILDEVPCAHDVRDSLRLERCTKCGKEIGIKVSRKSIFSFNKYDVSYEIVSEDGAKVREKLEELRSRTTSVVLYESGCNPCEE